MVKGIGERDQQLQALVLVKDPEDSAPAHGG